MQIIWTDKFNRSYEYIFTCATDIYPVSILRTLRNGVNKGVTRLLTNPCLGSIEPSIDSSDGIEFRRIIIKPYFKVVYSVIGDDILMVDIWDTRRDPSLLTKNF